MSNALFDAAFKRANDTNAASTNKIGNLGEKILHLTLKYYYDLSGNNHEIKVGNYYVDVLIDNKVFEIQTRSFDKLRNKLSFLLNNYTVTICFPIPHIKYLSWYDQDNLSLSKERKSPRVGTKYDIFRELYKIKMFLKNENLKFRFLLLDLLEIRNLDGYNTSKKRGSSRYDRIPKSLVEEILINTSEDFNIFIPDELKLTPFSVDEYKKYTNLSIYNARLALNILKEVEAIKVTSKMGNKLIYQPYQKKQEAKTDEDNFDDSFFL